LEPKKAYDHKHINMGSRLQGLEGSLYALKSLNLKPLRFSHPPSHLDAALPQHLA
jgi:hypothetical protein